MVVKLGLLKIMMSRKSVKCTEEEDKVPVGKPKKTWHEVLRKDLQSRGHD